MLLRSTVATSGTGRQDARVGAPNLEGDVTGVVGVLGRNGFSVARRGSRRTLARFRHEDGAARAFMRAGVEIVSA